MSATEIRTGKVEKTAASSKSNKVWLGPNNSLQDLDKNEEARYFGASWLEYLPSKASSSPNWSQEAYKENMSGFRDKHTIVMDSMAGHKTYVSLAMIRHFGLPVVFSAQTCLLVERIFGSTRTWSSPSCGDTDKESAMSMTLAWFRIKVEMIA